VSTDVARLRQALAGLEKDAKTLAWNAERPWKPDTHVWEEGWCAVVDLHDLSIKLALRAVELAAADEIQSGAVHFVTGRGRHSIDGRSRLREAVSEALLELSEENHWGVREPRPGRLTLITDAELAPVAAKGGLEWWMKALGFAFLGLAAWVAPFVGIPLLILVAGVWLWSRKRA